MRRTGRSRDLCVFWDVIYDKKPFICLSKSVKSFMYGPASEKEVI